MSESLCSLPEERVGFKVDKSKKKRKESYIRVLTNCTMRLSCFDFIQLRCVQRSMKDEASHRESERRERQLNRLTILRSELNMASMQR